MSNNEISHGHISASSQYEADRAPFHGRLKFNESGGCWSASSNDASQWLQVDLGNIYTEVTRVATQGRNGINLIDWVKNYMLHYGNDGINFHYYREQGETADKVQPTR